MNRLKKIRSLVHCGNRKLSTDTMITNMCTGRDCPAAKLGLCKNRKICYTLKSERLYPEVLPYRRRQQEYWHNTDVGTIIDDYCLFLDHKYVKVRQFRYNESGDFLTTADIEKLHEIAIALHRKYQIITYGYSARVDLMSEYIKHTHLQRYFVVKLSGYEIPGLNSTCVVNKNEQVPTGYKLCPGKNCMSKCRMCLKRVNVAFRKH